MRKLFIVLAFAIAYATFLSLGAECVLMLLGASMVVSLDGVSVPSQLPRFLPFCMTVGFLSLIALVVIFIINLKVSEKIGSTKIIWWTQMIMALLITYSMMKPWEFLFKYLQAAF